MVYDLLIKDKLDVFVYDQVPFFCQWGTPKDLEQYLYWINTLKNKKDIA